MINTRKYRQETHQEMKDVTQIAVPFLRLTPLTAGLPGTISVKFCTEVKGRLRYKMAKKYCRMFQVP